MKRACSTFATRSASAQRQADPDLPNSFPARLPSTPTGGSSGGTPREGTPVEPGPQPLLPAVAEEAPVEPQPQRPDALAGAHCTGRSARSSLHALLHHEHCVGFIAGKKSRHYKGPSCRFGFSFGRHVCELSPAQRTCMSLSKLQVKVGCFWGAQGSKGLLRCGSGLRRRAAPAACPPTATARKPTAGSGRRRAQRTICLHMKVYSVATWRCLLDSSSS